MDTKYSKQVVERVRVELARKRISQRQIAKSLHLSSAAVNRRMLGRVNFNVTELHTIAGVLDIPVAHLMGESAEKLSA